MANLRIIYDNAADASTITASTTSGSLVASNMKTDIKSEIHRSTGTSVSYTLTWSSDKAISAVALPCTNLSASSTIRVRLYNAGSTLLADSGTVLACSGLNLGLWNWTAALNVNTFAYGGFSKTAVWFSQEYSARSLVIDLVDTSNPAGYIDCSRVVSGSYFEPSINADFGVETNIIDLSKTDRSAAGDLISDKGTMHDTLNFSVSNLTEAERAKVMLIMRKAGVSKNIFISVLPNNTSATAEQDFMIYGKRSNSAVKYNFINRFANTFDIQGW